MKFHVSIASCVYSTMVLSTVLVGGIFGASAAHAQTISGFSTATETLNGGATISNNILTLTDGANNEARSAFYNTKVGYSSGFTTSFVYTPSGYTGSNGADGIAFILQNSTNGASAIGGGGGSLGYTGINPSAALQINIYTGHTQGTAFGTNGVGTTNYTSTSPITYAAGDPIKVTLTFSSSADSLSETLVDTTTNSTFSTTYTATGLDAAVGGTTAYVGFSGATGGSVSTQTISNFSFTNNANAPEPSALGLFASIVPLGALAGRHYRRNRKEQAAKPA